MQRLDRGLRFGPRFRRLALDDDLVPLIGVFKLSFLGIRPRTSAYRLLLVVVVIRNNQRLTYELGKRSELGLVLIRLAILLITALRAVTFAAETFGGRSIQVEDAEADDPSLLTMGTLNDAISSSDGKSLDDAL